MINKIQYKILKPFLNPKFVELELGVSITYDNVMSNDFQDLLKQEILYSHDYVNGYLNIKSNNKFYITPLGRSALEDYLHRESTDIKARNANIIAIIALVVSVISIVLSFCLKLCL
jgi:hypothetical protein